MIVKKAKRLLAILACLALLISVVAACGSKDDGSNNDKKDDTAKTDDTTKTGDTTKTDDTTETDDEKPAGDIVSARDSITVAVTADRGTLDPLYTVGWDNQQSLRCVYEPLWEFDQDFKEIRYVLATDIDDSDPIRWKVKLRDDVYFANGNKFTAEDVVWSLWIANNREGEPPYFLYMDHSEDGTKVIDEYTVEIVFTKYQVGHINTFATIFMYDEESYNLETAAYETNGTGPYVVSDYVINSHLSLTLRDDYWGKKPPIKNITWRVLAEEAQRVNALQTGEIDVVPVPFQDVEYVKSMPNITVRELNARSNRAIVLNCTNPDVIFYDNMDARLAVFHSIDPEAVLRIVYNNYGQVSRAAYTMFASDANPDDYDIGIYGHGYDVELARQLAESSGLTEVELLCINNGASDMVMTAEILQECLKQIGVTMHIQTTDTGSWLDYRFDENAFDLCIDFSGGNPASTDLAVWWRYCAASEVNGVIEDPIGAERLRELTDTVGEVSDLALRKQMTTEMNYELVNLNLFYNMVDMVRFQARNANIELPLISTYWIDWANAYWTA